jgi:hypothetical protein
VVEAALVVNGLVAGKLPLVPVAVEPPAGVVIPEKENVAVLHVVSAVTNCQCYIRPGRIKNITELTGGRIDGETIRLCQLEGTSGVTHGKNNRLSRYNRAN